MIFKSIREIPHAFFARKEYSPMVFEYSNCTVEIKTTSKEEELPGKDVVICETTLQRNANKRIKAIFGEIAEGVYKDSEKAERLKSELEEKLNNGEITGYNSQFDILPKIMQDYLNNVSDDLHSYGNRTYKAVRWINGFEGPVNPFSGGEKTWSFDGTKWHQFPKQYSIEYEAKTGLRGSKDLRKIVKPVVENGNSEPLANELYLEAFNLKSTHPRSALLIGIAAAETGVKQFITNLQPQTKWIIENMQSPDILSLIKEYIPSLEVNNTIKGEVLFPQKSIIKPLRKGIQMRNIVAHGGTCSLTSKNLKATLKAVRQLLWLLDYYSGYDWALEHFDEEVKVELNIN